MNKKLLIRTLHRYIGLVLALQLLAWTVGGIWFSWNDLDNIHGDHLVKTQHNNATDLSLMPVQNALDKLSDLQSLISLKVIDIVGQPIYAINYNNTNNQQQTRLMHAITGELQQISQQIAIQIAQNHINFNAEIANIEYLTQTDSHHEYREKPLPAWAITFDHSSSPTLYVSIELGTVTAIRHSSWRIFDFLWMLHTMDYQSRDNFNNWLIKIFSIIALVTALSGIILFFISRKKKPQKTHSQSLNQRIKTTR